MAFTILFVAPMNECNCGSFYFYPEQHHKYINVLFVKPVGGFTQELISYTCKAVKIGIHVLVLQC
jgi:hypothetical protein